MKRGLRQALISLTGLAIVFAGLMFVDPRVRDQFGGLFTPTGASSLGDRLGDLAGALWSAARHQSIENAPLVVFATVGALLFIFMVRT
jgi:hypothetical protein